MANPLAPVVLTPDTVHTFTLDADYNFVEVLNVDGTAEVFFRVDGDDPAVDGAGSHLLPAAIGSLTVVVSRAGNTIVKIVSAGTPRVAVRGIDPQ